MYWIKVFVEVGSEYFGQILTSKFQVKICLKYSLPTSTKTLIQCIFQVKIQQICKEYLKMHPTNSLRCGTIFHLIEFFQEIFGKIFRDIFSNGKFGRKFSVNLVGARQKKVKENYLVGNFFGLKFFLKLQYPNHY